MDLSPVARPCPKGVRHPVSSRRSFDLVVIAASAGGPGALRDILRFIPESFPAPIVVVQHLACGYQSALNELLTRSTALPLSWVTSVERLVPGHIYLAPQDHHVTVRRRTVRPLAGPRINFSRPAADPLFTSAAQHFGDRTLAVVLTGRLNDGSRGAAAVRRAGGVVLVQRPDTCIADGMPRAAINHGAANFILSPRGIASAMISLVMVRGAVGVFGVADPPALATEPWSTPDSTARASLPAPAR